MKSVWVLSWHYSDRSGGAIVRAYEDETRAREDFALVEEDYTRNYELAQVPFWSQDTPREE
jgi:hypothetical protein